MSFASMMRLLGKGAAAFLAGYTLGATIMATIAMTMTYDNGIFGESNE